MEFSWLLLLVTGITCQYIILPDSSPATIEDGTFTTENCTIIDVFPEDVSIATESCSQVRQKRTYYSIFGPPWNPYEKQQKAKMEAQKKADAIKQERVQKIRLLLNSSLDVSFNQFSDLLKWNGTKLAIFFKYDHVSDAWASVKSKSLECNQGNYLELHVCGPINVNRRKGEHKFVSSIGKFSSLGTVYKHIKLPMHALRINKNFKSVSSCRWLSTMYECIEDRNMPCTIKSYQNCSEIVHLTPNKIFTQEFGDQTLVAADYNEYETYLNGTLSTHQIDFSKLVFLRLPPESYAKFGNFKVFGRASNHFDHFSINKHSYVSNLTHFDLDVLETQHGKQIEIDQHREIVPIKSNFSLTWWWVALPIVIVLVAVIGTALYVRRLRTRHVPSFEPRVFFHNLLSDTDY